MSTERVTGRFGDGQIIEYTSFGLSRYSVGQVVRYADETEQNNPADLLVYIRARSGGSPFPVRESQLRGRMPEAEARTPGEADRAGADDGSGASLEVLTADAGQLSAEIDRLRTALVLLHREHGATGRQIALLSVRAIAARARAALPEAAFVGLSEAQYGTWQEPAGYYASDGTRIGGDCGCEPAGGDELRVRVARLDEGITPYCTALDDTNSAAWKPFTTEIGPGGQVDDGQVLLMIDRAFTAGSPGSVGAGQPDDDAGGKDAAGDHADRVADAMRALLNHVLAAVPPSQRGRVDDRVTDLLDLATGNLSPGARDQVVRQALAEGQADPGAERDYEVSLGTRTVRAVSAQEAVVLARKEWLEETEARHYEPDPNDAYQVRPADSPGRWQTIYPGRPE